MVRDSFFRMSMQKPLQHSLVYDSEWPMMLQEKDEGKAASCKKSKNSLLFLTSCDQKPPSLAAGDAVIFSFLKTKSCLFVRFRQRALKYAQSSRGSEGQALAGSLAKINVC